ncbi:Septum formation protein Maf [Anoxybacillus sp. BCO1]|nr:Septum formation protein Maf [Anoxybacillus sp. BCO1]
MIGKQPVYVFLGMAWTKEEAKQMASLYEPLGIDTYVKSWNVSIDEKEKEPFVTIVSVISRLLNGQQLQNEQWKQLQSYSLHDEQIKKRTKHFSLFGKQMIKKTMGSTTTIVKRFTLRSKSLLFSLSNRCILCINLVRYKCIFLETNAHDRKVMTMQLVLASSSPRRKQLLHMLGLPFDILVSDVDESFDEKLSPSEIVQQLAYKKANAVWKQASDACVIGADTIVVCDGEVLGKPSDEQDAFRMLKRLSGTTHEVWTGVAICTAKACVTFAEKTDVTFWPLSDDDIWAYIATKEPLDKAGAYGIQQRGALFVQKIDGDYFSVVGLPIAKLARELKKFRFYPFR